MARRGRFKRLDRTIPSVLRQLGLDRAIEEQRLLDAWPELVDKKLAGHTRAVSLEQGVLVVEVDNQVWMTQLRFLKGEIIRALAARFRPGSVRDIRFVSRRGA